MRVITLEDEEFEYLFVLLTEVLVSVSEDSEFAETDVMRKKLVKKMYEAQN